MTPDEEAQIGVLQQQQAYQTNVLRAMLEARWTGGADTAEGWLVALDPSLDGQLDTKVPVYD
jgi:hypothetical protein